MIRIPKHIAQLKPYKAGKPIEELAREKKLTDIIKLASNENPLGPSPMAMEAVARFTGQLNRYSNPSAYKLVKVIADKYNKMPPQVITASGSDSLIQYIIMAFTENDDELLTSAGTFIGWYVNADKNKRKSLIVPLKNYHLDLEGILNSITSKTRIIYLANPNNPTGTIFTKYEFESFMKLVPQDILVVLDEAYTVYAEDNPDYPNGMEYEFENLIVLRTLSKAYGLAGLRAGFAVSQPYIINELYKVKLPFEPNLLAQEAAAAAFNDSEFLKKTVEQNSKSLQQFSQAFDTLGIRYISTNANFYLMIFQSAEIAAEFNAECLNRGLILRHTDTFGIPNGIRINSGTDEETEKAIIILSDVNYMIQEKYGQLVECIE
jgi:histidinol-phosphate aminotransferase